MWCLSGIPGSGKSTICRWLNNSGIQCLNALEIPGAERCVESGEVDTECLKFILSRETLPDVIESHFSHVLGCGSVIILERSEDGIARELESRGYNERKIGENLDALRSDVIYSESLEMLPAGRIHRIHVDEGKLEDAFEKCRDLILKSKNKD